MLAIRLQRVGRTGHAEFRIIVQEAQRSPSSGRVVKQIGHYNPHTKVTVLDKEAAALYLSNGAQPSPRAAMLMQKEGVKLPIWVKIDNSKSRAIKKTDKLRRNQPAAPAAAEAEVAEVVAEEPAAEPVVAQEAPVEAEAEVAA